MQVLTERLIILPKQDLAKTDSPVVIKQAPKTVIHATGMVFDKKHQTIKLSKRVKVHYERPIAVKPKTTKPATNKSKAAKPKIATKTSIKKSSIKKKALQN